VDTRHTGALALMAPQHEVVHFIYADQEIVGVEIPLNKEDFRQGSLKRNSYIRIDKIASIEKYLIKYKAGSKQEKFNEILNRVIEFLKN